MNIRTQISTIEHSKTIEHIYGAKGWAFEKVNKIDKPLAR